MLDLEDKVLLARDESSHRGQRFREGPHSNVHIKIEMRRGSGTSGTHNTYSVCIIDHERQIIVPRGLVDIRQEKGEWTGKLCENPDEDVVQLFGYPADKADTKPDYAPTRLTVRDSKLLNEPELANAENTDMYCTEIKTEVSIDRLTSQANPRQFERVPAGARFCLDLVLDIYNVDIEKNGEKNRADRFVNLLSQALALVEELKLWPVSRFTSCGVTVEGSIERAVLTSPARAKAPASWNWL